MTAAAPTSPWRDHWYAVAALADLDPGRPLPFRLLDEPLVLWFDREGDRWRAFSDRCPHRLVPLSEGRLDDAGHLECPYHGWSFDGGGRCLTIPQQEQGQRPGVGSACRPWATACGQGLLFVFAGDPSRADDVPLPLVPALDEAGWLVQDTFRDLPYDALTLLENVLDVSHVPFTHHATVGKRETAGPVDLELVRADAGGFAGHWAQGPRRGTLGPQDTTFLAPGLLWHDLTAPGFARILTVVYATPMAPGRARLVARFPFRFEKPLLARLFNLTPRWLRHLGNNAVLEDDQLFLHQQERELERRGGSAELLRACHLPTPADRYVQALHRWVLDHGGVPFPGQPLPPPLGTPELLERLHSHTDQCRSCRGALRRLERIERWGLPLLMLLVIPTAWAGATILGALGLLLLLAGSLGLMQVHRWVRGLRQGSPVPARNRS